MPIVGVQASAATRKIKLKLERPTPRNLRIEPLRDFCQLPFQAEPLWANCQMSEIKSNADVEPCLSVVMPVYNEAATVAEVIKVVLAQRPVQQLVVVDDASTDGTWEKLQSATDGDARVTLVRHEQNQGKGAALRTGFRPGDGARRDDSGRRFGIRSDGISPAARPDFVRQGGCGVWVAVSGRRGASRVVLLALGGQQPFDHFFQHGHRSQPVGHGNLLQSFPAGSHSKDQN